MFMRIAAIGIGSNSLRMLVADVDLTGKKLRRVVRERKGLRVFAALDEKRNISEEMIRSASESVLEFVEQARRLSSEKIHIFATSAVRDAQNQQVLASVILNATGIELHICSGELEAKLSFLGAAGRGRSGMIDIGGGSTEIVIGQEQQQDYAVSLQLGAVRLHRMKPIASVEDVRRVILLAETELANIQEKVQASGSLQWVGVGGTLTTLSALAQNVAWTDKEKIHGYVLTQEKVRRCMEWIAPMPIVQRQNLKGLHPQRADIVVHGMAVLCACMTQLSIEDITVSEYGNLEGYLHCKYLLSF